VIQGQFFGEYEIMTHANHREYTAQAKTYTELYYINAD